jgi:potassium/hydrogen antiporter
MTGIPMEISLHFIFVATAILLVTSVVASKLAVRIGVPALVLFILVGMGFGSEGFGGIHFDNPQLTQSVGVTALVFILFAGGLEVKWEIIRPALKEGILLATIGVAITTASIAWFAHTFFGFNWVGSVLLGATIAPTDAAAVFSVLTGNQTNLKGKLQAILELESGFNDPMAIFLTLGMIHLATDPSLRIIDLIPSFFIEMALGLLIGIVLGRVMLFVINRIRLEYTGLYPVLTISFVLLTYGLSTLVHGNGFLAVYVAGLVLGRSNFLHKTSLRDFHDGLAWLMQIVMFLVLGLQVFPSRLIPIAGSGTILAIFLVFIARPLSVFIALMPTRQTLREKLFISWVGLRGAAPIILATFSLLNNILLPLPIFELVFFVVMVSVLLQGTTIIPVARWLGVYDADGQQASLLAQGAVIRDHMIEVTIPPEAGIVNKRILDLKLPDATLIVVIHRNSRVLIPQGSTTIQPGDHIVVLSAPESHEQIHDLLTK